MIVRFHAQQRIVYFKRITFCLAYLQRQSRSWLNFSVQSEDSVLSISHFYMTYTGFCTLAQLRNVQGFTVRKILSRKSEIERRRSVDLDQNISRKVQANEF